MVFEMVSSLIGKLGNHKRLFVASVETDSLSKLPDNLVDYILELLPVRDAVRTSILSRNWRYRWTTMRSLVLDEHFSNKLVKNNAYSYNGFLRVTNQLFYFLKGPILKVHLHIPKIYLDSFQEVNQWILWLSKDHVIREITLNNLNRSYQLPSYLFHCSQLRRLKLKNCIFKPPLEFRRFLYLKKLYFTNITFGASLSGSVIELPQLKKLFLVQCNNVYNFNIVATKLRILSVINCFDAMVLQLLLIQRLTMVELIINKPITQVERVNIATILSNLPYLKSLSMDECFLKFSIAENIHKWLPCTANKLVRLDFYNLNFSDLNQLQAALFMLRSSPNLEQLSLKTYGKGLQNMDLDVNSALTYLGASDCFDMTLSQLKTIKFERVKGSRPLLLFIKLLLDHSPALEVISIRLSVTSNVSEKYKFAKDVMRFPRASTKAELIFLDP